MYLNKQGMSNYRCIRGVADNRPMSIGDRIKQVRTDRKMSQADLAKKVGVSQGTIGHIEAGRNDSSRYLVKIAAVLRVRAEWLQTGRGQMDSDWPLEGVTPEEWAALPEAEREEVCMIVRSKVARLSPKSTATAA